MKVNILGTEYEIKKLNEMEYPKLKKANANGLAELYAKELIISTEIDDGSGTTYSKLEEFENKVVRHEIIHAFFHESGLDNYGENEELVNWLALQVPKMLDVFKSANCL